MRTFRQFVASQMVRVHKISPELAAYHVSQMDEAELQFRVRMYAGMELSVAGPNPRAVPESSTRFSRPQRRRQTDGTQPSSREGDEKDWEQWPEDEECDCFRCRRDGKGKFRPVMPESEKENLVRSPGRFLPRLVLPESEGENLGKPGAKNALSAERTLGFDFFT